jgi:glycosyltransferase involved in cell wall biosynthesis
MLPGGANGGAKPFIFQLLQRLAARQPQARFTAACQADAAQELRAIETDNLKIHVQGTAVLDGGADQKRWLGSRRLARLQRRLLGGADRKMPQVQLLFCPFGVPLIQRPALATVCTFYDLQVEAYPGFFPAEVQRERLGHFRQMVSCATRIAAISEFSRELAITRGVEQQQIRAIAIQIPPRRDSDTGDSADTAPPLGLAHRGYLLYPANLWKHKNHELLFTAFAMARQQGMDSNLKLICSGDGFERLQELRKVASGLGLADAVLLPGFVSDAIMQALYRHALAVVFPSLYEGFGMPVIEAMGQGLPVACSNSTALKEVAGSAALLFHPGCPQEIATALHRLSEDGELRGTLIERGKLQAQRYQDPDAMADQYWDLFCEALTTSKVR